MPYWIADSLAGTPAFLWIYVGLGGIWALALLPRAGWKHRLQVLAVAFAAGPALLTAWMFILGTLGAEVKNYLVEFGSIGTQEVGRFLNEESVMLGTVALAVIGLALAWRKLRQPLPTVERRPALLSDERLLLVLIVAALVVRWVVIAYWPFTAYDSLWVYGYEGKLYALLGYIPQTIGYYPQFIPLQYTYAQLSGINDHVARASLIFLHAGSILATYVLGSRLISRRAGIIAAAIWALYPHVGEWSRAGDLEIPLAFLFTLAAAFYGLAWRGENARRNALLAGLALSVGMWTKPTMGAFFFGMGLLLLLDGLRVRFVISEWMPRLRVAILTALASLPLGGVWYIRNLTLGLPPLVFPPDFWQTLAQRSGGEFGWGLAALVAWAVYLYVRFPRQNWRLGAFGLALVGLALVPSILYPRRLSIIEFGLLAVGLVALAAQVRRLFHLWDDALRRDSAAVGWGLALALPYFITWFYSYSYHYRLSFAVVPLLILPTATVLARLFTAERLRSFKPLLRAAYLIGIVALAYPGIISAINDPFGGGDYLWTDKYPDDEGRYRSGNAALMNVVDGLNIWQNEHPGEKLVVSAPGIDRLPFFFPLQDIRVDDAPTRLAQLEDADYYVFGAPETGYGDLPPRQNQVVSALNRQDIMRRAWGMDDGIFRYDVYELNLQNRWTPPQPNGAAQADVVIGGFARYLGYDIGGLDLWHGRRVILHLFWQVLAPAPDDYTIFIHLRDPNDNLLAAWDGPVARSADGELYYSTLVWEPGEYISDERVLQLPEGDLPLGEGNRLVIGMYKYGEDTRLPITVDGEAVGGEYQIENRITIVGSEPS